MPPGLVVPAGITVRPTARRPGWVSGAWAARAVTGPPGLGLLAAPWLTAHTALSPREALATGLGAGAVGSIANARRRGSARRTEARLRVWRASRGELADVYRLDDLPPSEEGVWRLGPMTEPGPRGDYELQYRPWDGDPPHFLGVGSTGGGKSELARLLLGYPLSWGGWDVDVIDLKDASEYWPLPVHGDVESAARLLGDLFTDLRRRARLLRDVPREVTAPDGEVLEGRTRTFREIPEAERAGLRMRVVLIDEASLIVQPKPPPFADAKKPTQAERDSLSRYRAGSRAITLLRAITALGRSLGIHAFIFVQRADAELLPGFLTNNVQARVLLGENTTEAQVMTLGDARASATIIESDVAHRPPGRMVAAAVGGPGARLAQAYLVHESAYLRRARDAAGPAAPPPTATDHGGPPVDGSPDAHAPSVPRSAGPSPDRGYLPSGLRRGVDIFDIPPAAPVGSSAPADSAPPSHAPSSARTPAGLVARAALRAAAWRLLVGPLVPDSSPRPSGLRSQALAIRPHRCAACRTLDLALEVDHRRPRWARGSDRARNLWLLCSRCHGAKSREEAIVRKWRRRADPRALARVPALRYSAPFAAVALAGVASLGSPIALVLAALVVADCCVLMTQRSGLDGRNTLDARLEQLYGGPIALGSRIATGTMAGVNSVRLVLGGLGASYLAGFVLAWWW